LNLDTDCSFKVFTPNILASSSQFDCGEADLNDFFCNEALDYSEQLLGKSYCFLSRQRRKAIVCLFTVSNASIKVSDLPNNAKRRLGKSIPWIKQGRNYPAVLIGRLGVNSLLRGSGVGSQVLDFIKSWFVNVKNKTGCRFIIVDAYNNAKAIGFYSKNGFLFLFKDEDAEKCYNEIDLSQELKTRLMYFDLISIKPE